jgi:hypothetical protein
MCHVRVWQYEPTRDVPPEIAEPGDLDGRRAVLVAAPSDDSPPGAWLAVDEYQGNEATVLFGAPVGDCFFEYVRALLVAGLGEAATLGFGSVVAHWRAGWASAEPVLDELGFERTAPGIWRRTLKS